ncbi:hypothetical protein BpHYR1_048070 [Brachionus plicatilis]|uniref:Uncharacterized protein n=1 Tax=Brachionus plicatilis TaxID=10195 RepID=A0A3M7S289_BRAPC|nr:hypothetical protein BpHYR1_048070 [Brachionus plicatilis]
MACSMQKIADKNFSELKRTSQPLFASDFKILPLNLFVPIWSYGKDSSFSVKVGKKNNFEIFFLKNKLLMAEYCFWFLRID